MNQANLTGLRIFSSNSLEVLSLVCPFLVGVVSQLLISFMIVQYAQPSLEELPVGPIGKFPMNPNYKK